MDVFFFKWNILVEGLEVAVAKAQNPSLEDMKVREESFDRTWVQSEWH